MIASPLPRISLVTPSLNQGTWLDATMRSNVTVGPPFDLLLYTKDSLEVTRYRRVSAGDRDLNLIHSSWEQSLRRAVEQLPDIEFEPSQGVLPMVGIK